MKRFYEKYKHGWVFSYLIVYFLWFFWLEQRPNVQYAIVETKFDHLIPFNEIFAIPYFFWFVYISLPVFFFFFVSKRDFYKITAMLGIGMSACLLIYTIWPNAQNLRIHEFPRDNILSRIVGSLYGFDTATNVCPSIHVYNSIAIHVAICKSEYFSTKNVKWLNPVSFIIMILICLSTLFLKQHSIIDGICATILCLIVYRVVFHSDYAKEHEHENATV